MNVTVKVFCYLTIFVVAFLGQTIAKYSEFNEHSDPEWGYDNAESRYSEFSEDPHQPREKYIDKRDVQYNREKYIDKRDRYNNRERYVDNQDRNYDREKYADPPRTRRDNEIKEKKKHKYDEEQSWNDEIVQVEEGEEAPFDEVIVEDLEQEQLQKRKQKRSTSSPNDRYRNHRYEDDLRVEETHQIPQQVTRGSKKTMQYEVHEVTEEEPEPLVSETQTLNSPEVLYHQGVAYVKVPQHAYSFVDGAQPKHLARESVGAPPVTRYTKVYDQAPSASGKYHGSSHDHGGGKQGHDHHKNEHGHKSDKGHKSVHHTEHGAKGSEGHENHNKKYEELGGKKKSHHDAAGHYGEHHEGGQGKKGGKFDEKKGHKKGHNTKGYHNKYHKDEYHKEHKFYDDYHKSGSHNRYGDFKAQHGSKEGGHHKKAHHDSGLDHKNAGKKGQYEKGHVDDAHKGHKSSKAHEKHHSHHTDYGKKGGSQGGKEYGYKSGHK